MKTTQMVFRKLEVGEKTKPTDYQLTKNNEKGYIECILDNPSLQVSYKDGAPFICSCIIDVVTEDYGNHIYRRL